MPSAGRLGTGRAVGSSLRAAEARANVAGAKVSRLVLELEKAQEAYKAAHLEALQLRQQEHIHALLKDVDLSEHERYVHEVFKRR